MNFERLTKHIKSLIPPGTSTLAAVSGGVDSVVMVDILDRLDYPITLAHCNFQLRGTESDGDEDFVKELARIRGIPVFCERFDTEKYARSHQLSIQEAARTLRYGWFQKLAEKEDIEWIVVAHHGDDAIETFFINLIRGTGISGLTGLREKEERIVRPLLTLSKETIKSYAKDRGLSFREDSSNLSRNYLRNTIRQDVLPALDRADDRFRTNMQRGLKNLGMARKVLDEKLEEAKREALEQRGADTFAIDLRVLKQKASPGFYLFEWLSPLRFDPKVIEELAENLDAMPGRTYHSPSHRLIGDRSKLIVEPHPGDRPEPVWIHESTTFLNSPLPLSFASLEKSTPHTLDRNNNVAELDRDLLTFPLKLRPWNQGDRFRPLGMGKGSKKVSDLLVDEKVPIPEKERTWVLESNGVIAWVIGIRIADPFKVREGTKRILKVAYFSPSN